MARRERPPPSPPIASARRDRRRRIAGKPWLHAAFAELGTDPGCDPVGRAPRCGGCFLAAAARDSIASYRLQDLRAGVTSSTISDTQRTNPLTWVNDPRPHAMQTGGMLTILLL